MISHCIFIFPFSHMGHGYNMASPDVETDLIYTLKRKQVLLSH